MTTNFLDYHHVTNKILKIYIEWRDVPLYVEDVPRNSSLVFLNQSKKGVSRIYSQMKEPFSRVLDTAVLK